MNHGEADRAARSAATLDLERDTLGLLESMRVGGTTPAGAAFSAASPITGETIARIGQHEASDAVAAIEGAQRAFIAWREVPPPHRGELVRLFGEVLREEKARLARLVSIEVGKIASEGLGEVQEMIDICDFAVGLSRQLHGLTLATERPEHRMMESWHPLGVVGIITAFNFPVAVWAWNAALALICGNSIVWKPSEKAPLCAIAVQALFERAGERARADGLAVPDSLSQLLIGGPTLGEALADHELVRLVSATGSVPMGRAIGPRVAARFGRTLLELGGNNGAIVAPSADFDLALRGIAFAGMGTAGQRCTTMRRLFVHADIYEDFVPRLEAAYRTVRVGNPLDEGVLVGPLIDGAAYDAMQAALDEARALGAKVTGGERVGGNEYPGAFYIRPALVEMDRQEGPVLRETFAPILYAMRYQDLDAAIAEHNAVPQGLSSSIFTTDLREAEMFLSARGSDCGIANVNIGTSGAEIGGAFGGEKESGGGRESGSDSWRAYMRRATNTINYGRSLPLAQGVAFDL
jgi:aldehyde dehydrogenase (NAD+)